MKKQRRSYKLEITNVYAYCLMQITTREARDAFIRPPNNIELGKYLAYKDVLALVENGGLLPEVARRTRKAK